MRTVNEDALLVDEALRLFVVADGMGGHHAGDVASRITVETVQAFLIRSQDQAECTWPYGIDSRVSLDANRLLTALKVANRKVFRAADVAALAGDDSLCFGSVGDSRVYAHRAGTLARLTEDDSWLASIAAADATLTEEQKATHPMRHVLTKALGATPTIDVDVAERAVRAGEQFLLCSDGLHGAIEHDQARQPPLRRCGRNDRTGPAPAARTLRAAGAHRQGRQGVVYRARESAPRRWRKVSGVCHSGRSGA